MKIEGNDVLISNKPISQSTLLLMAIFMAQLKLWSPVQSLIKVSINKWIKNKTYNYLWPIAKDMIKVSSMPNIT